MKVEWTEKKMFLVTFGWASVVKKKHKGEVIQQYTSLFGEPMCVVREEYGTLYKVPTMKLRIK